MASPDREADRHQTRCDVAAWLVEEAEGSARLKLIQRRYTSAAARITFGIGLSEAAQISRPAGGQQSTGCGL